MRNYLNNTSELVVYCSEHPQFIVSAHNHLSAPFDFRILIHQQNLIPITYVSQQTLLNISYFPTIDLRNNIFLKRYECEVPLSGKGSLFL